MLDIATDSQEPSGSFSILMAMFYFIGMLFIGWSKCDDISHRRDQQVQIDKLSQKIQEIDVRRK